MRILSAVAVLLGLCLFSCSAEQKPLWEDVAGDKALAHVQSLVDLGPRTPGTEALEKSRKYIEKQLSDFGWKVTRQPFSDETPRGTMIFVNLIARFQGKGANIKAAPSFLLCSHYDTKVFSNAQFVGANDGGSSTGLLIELARVLAQRPALAAKVQLVFFDGEEAIEEFTDRDGLYGSRFFASELTKTKTAAQFRGGILLDMIGDKSLGVTLPVDSPPDMAKDIFAAAEALKCRNQFTYFDHGNIYDDHAPLNAAGIPTIDLIDFEYPPWHTPEDTMDKISAESLQTVGRVVVYYLTQFQPR